MNTKIMIFQDVCETFSFSPCHLPFLVKYMLKFSVFGPILIQIGCQFINVSNPFFKTCLAQKLISFSFKLQICFYLSMQLVKNIGIVKSEACWLFTTKIRNKVKLKNILLGFNLLINLIHKSKRDAKSINITIWFEMVH